MPVPPAGSDPDGFGDVLFPELGNPGVDVQDYDVKLTYDPTTGTIAGSVTLQISITADRDEITLDSAGPQIDGVTIDGAAVEFAPQERELRITPAEPLSAGDEIGVAVTYHETPGVEQFVAGLPVGWFNTDGGSYVLNEPDGVRSWLPSNDHPADKATWTFELTVPSGVTAVANGAHVSTTPGSAGDTWVWRQDEPMATYLVQVLTGDYELIEDTGPAGLPLLSVVLRDDATLMQPFVDAAAEQIDFFDDWFGPFPLDRYGVAMTDSFPGLAMETQGRSLFSRDDFQTGSLGYVESLLLSHELAHQWFGDAVTLERWKDIWLNESFATYAQWMWLDHVGLSSLDEEAANALATKGSDESHSTADPPADDLFGFNSYEGGAVVLQALRRTIGDDAFFTVLQRWVAENAGHSRGTEEFVALANEVAGADLTGFLQTWLFAADVPDSYPDPA